MITITNKKECCGCSACYNICPKDAIIMKPDSEGFLYPKVSEELCINCGLCEKTCPVVHKLEPQEKGLEKAYLLQHKNETVLMESTSGGAFSVIAEYVLRKQGIVYGAAFNKDFKVVHEGLEKREDIYRFRNSKYVQSDINTTFREVKSNLNQGRIVCYSGTPCQINALKKYLGKEYENLITVDVVCRAVPSPGIWKSYVEWLSNKGHISSIRFRDKELGYQYSTMKVSYQSGKTIRKGSESDCWLRMFLSGMIIRPSCTDCKFKSPNRVSDFTIWDCFNVYKLDKSINENKGVTRILVHSKKGEEILKIISESIIIKAIPYSSCISGVKQLKESAEMNRDRKAFFEDYKKMTFEELMNKYYPNTPTIQMKAMVRRMLNLLKLDVWVKHVLNKG